MNLIIDHILENAGIDFREKLLAQRESDLRYNNIFNLRVPLEGISFLLSNIETLELVLNINILWLLESRTSSFSAE